jgi:mono/diheme cytochrome c family protein
MAKHSPIQAQPGLLLILFCARGVSCLGLAGLVLVGCHGTASLTTQQAEGKDLYQVRCAHCHEDNDLGLKKVPPNLHGVFDQPVLPSGAPATDENVKRVVLSGKGMMPSFAGRFTEEQMAALLAYLHTRLR